MASCEPQNKRGRKDHTDVGPLAHSAGGFGQLQTPRLEKRGPVNPICCHLNVRRRELAIFDQQ